MGKYIGMSLLLLITNLPLIIILLFKGFGYIDLSWGWILLLFILTKATISSRD